MALEGIYTAGSGGSRGVSLVAVEPPPPLLDGAVRSQAEPSSLGS